MEKKKKAAAISIHVVLILVSITMLVPFIWMALTAFKTSTEATSVNPFVIFPAVWQTDNFKTVIDNMNFLQLYVNTILLIVGRVAAAFSRRRWRRMRLQGWNLRERTSCSPWYCSR